SVAYFSVSYNSNQNPDIYLWAKDRAENISRSTFYYHVRRKRFRKEKMNISDRFLDRILPYFSYYNLNPEDSNLQKFLKINNDIRKENNKRIMELGANPDPNRLWDGSWLRLEKAATMAKFADHRSYLYKGKKVDEKYHLGVDLASLANSPVKAGNNGKILFAERNGIYGLSVAIDHGQGLMSIYGHLSSLEVQRDQEVKKGELLGHTGSTGLAGGDHLHFGMLINGNYVNPIEWWDSHWIEDNIYRKLDLLKKQQ
ncbi:M23 family metallopeptidase, partial [Thermodesulfobacteriota bacterium]